MKLPRRQFFHQLAGAAVLPAAVRIARAESYPSRPVRIIVGFQAGTASDIIARLIAQWFSDRLGQQFVVENRPGAAGNAAAEMVVRAVPDGYTLLTVAAVHSISATLYENLNFSFARDIAPVASIIRTPLVMEVSPSFGAATVPDFIAYAKANPGKINMSSPGIGSINHVAGELFNMMAGVKLAHIPYRSSQFPDLLSGQVQITFNPLPSSLDFIRAGKLRGLAVTSATRSDALPDLPPLAQFLPGYEATAWFGVGAPKSTPAEIVQKLNKEINAALAETEFKKRLIDLGGAPMPLSIAQFSEFIDTETGKWAKVVKFSGAKAE